MSNPFQVYSPEEMPAEQVTKLFVPVAERLEIDGPVHVFVHGHRGCGKSMMLRVMAPDCQMLMEKKGLSDLPYLGIYATVKATGIDVTEYERLNNQYAGLVLAEHSLVSFLGAKTFQSLEQHCADYIQESDGLIELKEYVSKQIFKRLASAGADVGLWVEQLDQSDSVKETFQTAAMAMDDVYGICSDYLKRGSFQTEYRPYNGPILGYRDFLFPILNSLSKLSFMPQGKPIYFLVDDADNLNLLQTRVLNSWVSFRTGNSISFKISTQLNYKTWLTTSKQRIEAPHDFREVHVSSIHTGATNASSNYPRWVSDVVRKRLKDHGIDVEPEVFFPADEAQETRIKEFGEQLKKDWQDKPRGFRPGDDAYRYARVDYIKSLGGVTKQQSKYKYAGFDQLVHISSGIIRYFLDAATEMYADQEIANEFRAAKEGEGKNVLSIDSTIQDAVIRSAADQLMFGHLDKLEQEAMNDGLPEEAYEFSKLRNLIRGLGGIFQSILFSDRSERRVFSIALSDDPPEEIMRIIRLGVRYGYFYEASIGSKEGRWRTRRYIMTRRLASHFKLDPMGFSGYLFVTSELLGLAINSPSKAINSFKGNRLGSVVKESQLPLEF